jgi:hypothetical protein
MSIAKNLTTIAENVPKVYDAGHAKGLTDFQNMLTRNGQRGVYTNVFQGADFSGFTFNPTIYPTQLGGVFYNYNGAEFPKGIDFSKAINEESVTDTGKIPYQLFAYCRNQERIPDMNIPVQYYYTHTFRTCYVKKIDIIRVAETTQYSNAFSGCVYLEDVTFEGTIGSNISFANSPLTVECMKHIIEHLKDFSGDAENYHKYTLTVKNSAFSKLDTEGATAEYNGEACTWAELIDNKKWNLVKG